MQAQRWCPYDQRYVLAFQQQSFLDGIGIWLPIFGGLATCGLLLIVWLVMYLINEGTRDKRFFCPMCGSQCH